MATIAERFMARVEKNERGCWVWQGRLRPNGYGEMWLNGHTGYAHRIAYELFVGQVPRGLTLDHLCRNRACVNPDHLEPLTIRENVMRGVGYSAENARKTHCKHGHEFTPENTLWIETRSGRGRQCRECNRERARRRYDKIRKRPRL